LGAFWVQSDPQDSAGGAAAGGRAPGRRPQEVEAGLA
jgi:hypothetical protein